jgi:transposase-like protein
MTANQYRAALAKLNLSQRGAARHFQVDERTSRRWALGEVSVPEEVAQALRTMIEEAHARQ